MTDPRPRTLPVTPAHRPARARRVATAALLVVVALATVVAGPTVAAASPRAPVAPAQDPATSTTTATTATTAATGAETGTTDPATTVADEPESGAGSRRVADENRKIWLVVAALVAVAVALSLLTLRYWRQTRPSATLPPDELDDEELVVVGGAPTAMPVPAPVPAPRRDGPGRRSRRAVAGADHAEADEAWEPRGTGEHERVEVPASTRSPRPTRDQRAAAYQAAGRP